MIGRQIKKQISTVPGNSICGSEGLLLRGGRITKWKGRAASMSPHIGALSAGISVSAFAVSMALGSGLLLAPMASAQEVLSGSQTTTRTLNGSPLVVTTDPTFSVVTAAGDGVILNGTDGYDSYRYQ